MSGTDAIDGSRSLHSRTHDLAGLLQCPVADTSYLQLQNNFLLDSSIEADCLPAGALNALI
jgi:hypothetical protein